MNKEAYLELQRDLRPEFKIHHPLIDLCVSLLMVALFCYLVTIPEILPYVIAQILLGFIILRSLFLMHECAHGAAFKNAKLNMLVGNIHGVLCFLPFPAWRYTHLKHHTYSGVRGMDPLLLISSASKRPRAMSFVTSLLWKIGFPLVELIRAVGYLLSPLIIQKKTKDRALFMKSLFSIILLMGFWVWAAKTFPEFVNVQTFLPGILIYFILNELISLPQHLDMPSREQTEGSFQLWDHSQVTRSVGIYPFLARHLFLNFNLHTEHHIFPKLPWRQLPAARDVLVSKLEGSYKEAKWDWSLTNRQKSLKDLLALQDFHGR
jgi:omega-6 fatty acid desaturase (delta-12 desaturase)